MKLVINTQYRENYGAHDWDGRGECPQYWKFKGGDTYVLDISLEQAMSEGFYDTVFECIEHRSDYCEEYVLGSDLIDEIDYDESKVVDEWDTVIRARFVNGALECERDVKRFDDDAVVGRRNWIQDSSGKIEMRLEEFEEVA